MIAPTATTDTADTYKPRHAWPTEGGGERCANTRHRTHAETPSW